MYKRKGIVIEFYYTPNEPDTVNSTGVCVANVGSEKEFIGIIGTYLIIISLNYISSY